MTYDLLYQPISFSASDLSDIVYNIEEKILTQTNNFEVLVLETNAARKEYIEKNNIYEREYNKTYLNILAGKVYPGEKPVAQSVARDVAKAMVGLQKSDADIAKGILESTNARAGIELEKLNALKKLADARRGLGGRQQQQEKDDQKGIQRAAERPGEGSPLRDEFMELPDETGAEQSDQNEAPGYLTRHFHLGNIGTETSIFEPTGAGVILRPATPRPWRAPSA